MSLKGGRLKVRGLRISFPHSALPQFSNVWARMNSRPQQDVAIDSPHFLVTPI